MRNTKILMARLVEALRYKPEGRGLDSLQPWGRLNLLTKISIGDLPWGVKAGGA
jgi:hypothetical protein